MSSSLPPLSVSTLTDIYRDFQKLCSDYWILEGAFGGNAVFVSANFSSEDLEKLDKTAFGLIKALEEKAWSKPPGQVEPSEITTYHDLHLALQTRKNTLTALRIRLEGPTWYNYDPEVNYQIIGNQRNPGQTGTAVLKRRKSTRTATKARKSTDGSMASSFKGDSASRDYAAEGLVALASASKGKQAAKSVCSRAAVAPVKSSPLAAGHANGFIYATPSPLGGTPVSLDLTDQISQLQTTLAAINRKRSEALADFAKTIVHFESENIDLENKIQELNSAHQSQIAEKDRMIAEKDASIANKDMLIGKYKMCLLPHGIHLDEENGEIQLSSIGKRGMGEDDEADRVRNLKKRKVDLHVEVDDLAMQKEKLLSEVKGLKDKAKAADQGEALRDGELGKSEGLIGGSLAPFEQLETSSMEE